MVLWCFAERFASKPVICELAHCDPPAPTSCTSAALFEQTDNSCPEHVLSIRRKDGWRTTTPFPPLLSWCKCSLCCWYALVMQFVCSCYAQAVETRSGAALLNRMAVTWLGMLTWWVGEWSVWGVHYCMFIQGVPLATEPGISLIILTPMKI